MKNWIAVQERTEIIGCVQIWRRGCTNCFDTMGVKIHLGQTERHREKRGWVSEKNEFTTLKKMKRKIENTKFQKESPGNSESVAEFSWYYIQSKRQQGKEGCRKVLHASWELFPGTLVIIYEHSLSQSRERVGKQAWDQLSWPLPLLSLTDCIIAIDKIRSLLENLFSLLFSVQVWFWVINS